MLTPQEIQKLLDEFKADKISEQEVIRKLQKAPLEKMAFATVDQHRTVRQGFPEVIFCENKTDKQINQIAEKILEHQGVLLATHAEEHTFNYLKLHFPELIYNSQARCIHSPFGRENGAGKHLIGILTAGTGDIPVAEEAAVTVRLFGFSPVKIYDVGVAGIHRLGEVWDEIQKTRILIVIAGMEGALPSVIGGITDKPVIAVPTSVGYGTHLKGFAPLFAMLNSCANNVSVVNIDNGFGAGYFAGILANQLLQFAEQYQKAESA